MKDREAVTTRGRAVFYAAMWNDFRQVALDNGWALALHGSLANDMDIMGMPWTEDAIQAIDLVFELKKCFNNPKHINITESVKPHGRVAYTLAIFADFYIDLSIIDVRQELE